MWDSMWAQQRTTPQQLLEQGSALSGYSLGMKQGFPRVAFHRRQAAGFWVGQDLDGLGGKTSRRPQDSQFTSVLGGYKATQLQRHSGREPAGTPRPLLASVPLQSPGPMVKSP